MNSKDSAARLFRDWLADQPQADQNEFKGLQGQDKDDFMMDWNNKVLDAYETTYSFREVVKHIDERKIVWQNTDQLVIDEGGWKSPQAVAGSMQLFTKNLALGFPWVFDHPQTGRQMWGKLVFSYTETHEKCWESLKQAIATPAKDRTEIPIASFAPGDVLKEKPTVESGAELRMAMDQQTKTPTPPNAKAKVVAPAKAKGKTKAAVAAKSGAKPPPIGAGNDAEEDPIKVAAKEFKLLAKQALDLKKHWLVCHSRATEAVSLIESGTPEWATMNNMENKGKLTSMISDVREGFTRFHKEWLSVAEKDDAAFQKRFLPNQLSTEFILFMEFKSNIDAVFSKLTVMNGTKELNQKAAMSGKIRESPVKKARN